MNRTLKTLLIWLLIAVTPLHAVAATVGMSCARGHHQMMQAVAPVQPARAMSEGADHHHDATGAAASADTASGDADDCAFSPCSGCSASCMGAAAPPPVFAPLPPFGGAENAIVTAATPVAGFIPESPRRPPRHLSA